MIVGNNSILNQYVPTFYIRDLIDGQGIIYDSVRKAFVNSDITPPGGVQRLGQLLDVSNTVDNPLSLQNGQALIYNSLSGLWENTFTDYNTLLNKPTIGTGSVTSITVNGTTGRITSSGSPITTSGTITLDLATTTVVPGSYTVANITVDAYGRITSAANGSPGVGTVTSVSVVTQNGISGTVATATSTPAITLSLGAITPTSVAASGTLTGSNLSGTNTGDQTITLTGDVTGTGNSSFVTTLATVNSSPQIDQFCKITVNNKGLVTATTPVSTSDIRTLVDATYVSLAGSTMNPNANLVFSGSGKVTGLAAPSVATDATNKAYVDALTAGLSWKNAVRAATTTSIALTGAQTIDGVAIISGNRVLVKNQASPAENGIYVASGISWSRSDDMNEPSEFDGAAVFVQEGTTLAGTGWTQTATVTTVGSSTVTFSQFTGGALYTWGVGLVETGNTVSVNLGSGIKELPTDEIGIDVASGKAIQLTGTGLSAGDQLTFVLDAGSGMEQSATGLKISSAGVTNAMLANSSITVTGTSGSDAVALGESVAIIGGAGGEVSTAMGTNSLTISVRDATSSLKGVASFNTADFLVTAGDVTIKTGGNLKAVKATVSLGVNASVNIGAALPAGSTILSVKVNVTASNTTSTLVVGKSGGSEYMTASENDPQTIGLYIAEEYVTEAGSVQVQATVAGQTGGVGSADVIVTYQLA